jgi:hypothetical protein
VLSERAHQAEAQAVQMEETLKVGGVRGRLLFPFLPFLFSPVPGVDGCVPCGGCGGVSEGNRNVKSVTALPGGR